MKTTKILLGLSIILLAGCSQQTIQNAEAQSVEVKEVETIEVNNEYTLEEMLVLAILDEYKAHQTYIAIMDVYGAINPFQSIMRAETSHIAELLPLFAVYDIEVPQDKDLDIQVPSTLEESYKAGVEAEILNIAMYEEFLATDLPDDVAAVFENLMKASYSHLDAFTRASEK